MKLIVGLGNPGDQFENTRHNAGFLILDKYLGDVHWSTSKCGLFYKKNDVIFLKPSTFINLSGSAVKYFCDYYKIEADDILIIHDDLDLEIGAIRLKYKSSSGGHNGIKSIIEELKTTEISRIKIGISRPSEIWVKNYVLGSLSNEELEKIYSNQKEIAEIIEQFVEGIDYRKLMGRYNKRKNEGDI